MTFEVTILGCGAATPTSKHNPSAQVVDVHDKYFLVDCGEATQMQMRKFKIKMQRLSHVFISHMHGDHYLGLMGFISSLHLLGRKAPLHIYGPEHLKIVVEMQLKCSDTYLEFPLEFHATSDSGKHLIYEDKSLEIYSFPLKHRIYCCGFLFQEKERKPKVLKEKIDAYKLQPSHIIQLKRGEDTVLDNGTVVTISEACVAPDPPRSYAYCSDTIYHEKLAQHIMNCNLLYHESTFLESEKDRAKSTFHSTAKQAAMMALKTNAKRLVLGHYSSRYANDQDFLKEAKEIFGDVVLADEGRIFLVPQR